MNNNINNVSIDLESVLTLNKTELNEIIQSKVDEIEEGYIDEYDMYIYLRKCEYIVTELSKYVKDKIDPNKLNQGLDRFNTSLKSKNTAARYDYSKCNDSLLTKLSNQNKELSSALKDRERFLQTLSEPIEIVDQESGEVQRIVPPIKLQAQTIEIKIF